MKLVHVRTIPLSCMEGFENNLVQMINMTKTMRHEQEPCRYVEGLFHSLHLTLCIDFSETRSCLPITWSSILGFINNVAQMLIMTRRCVANKTYVTSSKFKVIDHT